MALAAPRGTLLDPRRLEQINRLERQIEAIPLVSAVTGPGLIAEQAAPVREAPAQVDNVSRATSPPRNAS